MVHPADFSVAASCLLELTVCDAEPFSFLSLRGARKGDVAIYALGRRRLLRLRLAMTLRGGLRHLGMVSD